MKKLTEQDVIKIAVLTISRVGSATTSEIKQEVRDLLALQPDDFELLKNRGNEPKWEQIVRNLVSHRTLDKLGYSIYMPETKTHYVTYKGLQMVQQWLRSDLDG